VLTLKDLYKTRINNKIDVMLNAFPEADCHKKRSRLTLQRCYYPLFGCSQISTCHFDINENTYMPFWHFTTSAFCQKNRFFALVRRLTKGAYPLAIE
jgi:hypothetical protein